MSLGDYYVPQPPLWCPVCGGHVGEWEGFNGPGRWLVWTQGEPTCDASRTPNGYELAEATQQALRLRDGTHLLFAGCLNGHRLLAHAEVVDGVWEGLELVDAEGHAGEELVDGFRLWWTVGRLVSIAPGLPTRSEAVVPATVSALGVSDACILATRRNPGTGAQDLSEDEWWVVDVADSRAHGPVAPGELRGLLDRLGLEEPPEMTLPEELGSRRR